MVIGAEGEGEKDRMGRTHCAMVKEMVDWQ
jgi:hypothetical protein